MLLNVLQQNGIKYYVTESSTENKILWKLTDNPIDFKTPPAASVRGNGRVPEPQHVYMFWKSSVLDFFNEEKAMALQEAKKRATLKIAAYLRMLAYRSPVILTYVSKDKKQTYKKSEPWDPRAGWIMMLPQQKIHVCEKILKFYKYAQVADSIYPSRGHSFTKFIPDATKFNRKYHKMAVEIAAKLYDWDGHRNPHPAKRARFS